MRFIAGSLLLVGLAASSSATVFTVVIQDMEYAPDPTIQLGDTVRWMWEDGFLLHSVTAAAGQAEFWDSDLHSQGFVFDHTFTHAGQFNYYCTMHGFDAGNGQVGGMAGFVNVVPEPASMAALAWGGLALAVRRLKGKR